MEASRLSYDYNPLNFKLLINTDGALGKAQKIAQSFST